MLLHEMSTTELKDEASKVLAEVFVANHFADGEYMSNGNTNYRAVAGFIIDSVLDVGSGRLLFDDDYEFKKGIIQALIIECSKRI